ncbi:MAG: fatty acid desaturase family protein [Isosphaeraceae bacterium]
MNHGRRDEVNFGDRDLQHQIMQLRRIDNITNLICLAIEYVLLAGVIGGAIFFSESRAGWGLSWGCNVPVFLIAIVLVGALQHRLAGLGHEASHYTFLKNRFFNDFIPDLFCMFPLLTTVHFYRVFHMAHHQFTNDPQRDPDLLNLGHGKRAFEFPMTRGRFIATVYFCMLTAPARFLQFQLAYIAVNALGKGRSIYTGTEQGGRFSELYLPRLGTVLGLAYLVVINVLLGCLARGGRLSWIVPAGVVGMTVACLGANTLPAWTLFSSPFRQAYSCRFASAARLCFFTSVFMALAIVRGKTSGHVAFYPLILWFVPLVSSFPFFMLLRDVYQHSNADTGRLTNSRVFFIDPLTRWAVFVYGQDMHIPHHLFPAIPHYRLKELHQLLKKSSLNYRGSVVECYGTFHDPDRRVTILDEMTRMTHRQDNLTTHR